MKYRFAGVFVSIIALFVAFNSGYLLGQSPWAPVRVFPGGAVSSEDAQALQPFWEVYDLVQERYYEQPLDNERLAQGAIDGLLEALDDPHTRYLSPELQEEEQQGFNGELHGIGVEVSSENDRIVVVSPIEGTPAFAAGLQPGDILLQADGIDLTGMSVQEAAMHVRGPEGTSVRLLIERDGETFELEIERAVIQIDSVRGEITADNLAYVRLSHFGTRTAEELEETLEDLLTQDPQGLILDLRHNPGGSLTSVVDIADQFLPEGRVLVQRFGDGYERVYSATNRGRAEDIPLVVLVDEGSASASEVLAGAIRDRERGALIGATTFGKGTVQTWHPLSNGGGVRITIARWLTPDEVWINEEGLVPDVAVELPQELSADGEFVDTQLQAAVDYLLDPPVMQSPAESSGT